MMEEIQNMKNALTSFSGWADRMLYKKLTAQETIQARAELLKVQQNELKTAFMVIQKLHGRFE